MLVLQIASLSPIVKRLAAEDVEAVGLAEYEHGQLNSLVSFVFDIKVVASVGRFPREAEPNLAKSCMPIDVFVGIKGHEQASLFALNGL